MKKQQQYEEEITELKQENSNLKTITSELEQQLTEQNKELTDKLDALQKDSEDYFSLQKTHEQLKEEMKNSQDHLHEMFLKFNESNFDSYSSLPSTQTSNYTDYNELDILKQLEYQFKELLDQSFDYEEQLDSKFLLINELENKLTELTNEIEEIQCSIQSEETLPNKEDSELTS
jgi:chromosome segregation ATPase